LPLFLVIKEPLSYITAKDCSIGNITNKEIPMSKRNKQAKSWLMLQIGYIFAGATTLLSLVFVANFPDPSSSNSAVSMMTYGLTAQPSLLLTVIFPLAASIVLALLLRHRHVPFAVIALLWLAAVGYWFSIDNVFHDMVMNQQDTLQNIAASLQAGFFIIAPMVIAIVGISAYFTSINRAYSQPHPAWLIQARNLLFPRFSEINYLTLMLCMAVMIMSNPSQLTDAIAEDPRVLFILVPAIYISIRMLTRHIFSHEAKTWITFTYYGFLSFLSGISLDSQQEGSQGVAAIHGLNAVITIVILVVCIIRFLTTAIVFRIGSRKYEKLLNERFSDEQYSWRDFVFIAFVGLVTSAIVGDHYEAAATVLLLSFAYTNLAHSIVFVRAPQIVLGFRTKSTSWRN
jgi:hypothetical protein